MRCYALMQSLLSSVCASVCPSVCHAGGSYCQTSFHSDFPIIHIFDLQCRYPIPREPLLRGGAMGKLCDYRQDAAKQQTVSIKFTHRPKIRFLPHRGDSFFSMSRLVCLRVGDVVQTSIVWRFMSRFWCDFQRFFRIDCSFRCTTIFSFLLLGGTTIFAKLRS